MYGMYGMYSMYGMYGMYGMHGMYVMYVMYVRMVTCKWRVYRLRSYYSFSFATCMCAYAFSFACLHVCMFRTSSQCVLCVSNDKWEGSWAHGEVATHSRIFSFETVSWRPTTAMTFQWPRPKGARPKGKAQGRTVMAETLQHPTAEGSVFGGEWVMGPYKVDPPTAELFEAELLGAAALKRLIDLSVYLSVPLPSPVWVSVCGRALNFAACSRRHLHIDQGHLLWVGHYRAAMHPMHRQSMSIILFA